MKVLSVFRPNGSARGITSLGRQSLHHILPSGPLPFWPSEEITRNVATLREKLVAISLNLFNLVVANEAAFRTNLGLSLKAATKSQDGRVPL